MSHFTDATLAMAIAASAGNSGEVRAKSDPPVCARAEWDEAATEELVGDEEFMRHFEAGVRDLEAGRRISADDLERELGL